MPPIRKIRVLLVDDHPVLRQGLTLVIGQQKDIEVCGEVDSAAAATQILPRLKPDVAVVDLSLSDRPGLELLKDIQKHHPQVAVLVLTMHEESLYADRALRAGAAGYVMKNQAPDTIVAAIRKVARGELFISPQVSAKILQTRVRGAASVNAVETLTDRELEVLERVAQGKSTRQIANELRLSHKTVESHQARLKEKLGLERGRDLLRYAVEWRQSQNRVLETAQPDRARRART